MKTTLVAANKTPFDANGDINANGDNDVINDLLTPAHVLQQGNVFALCRSSFADEVKGWGGEQS